jgi:flagellar basal-body rod protein FlgC
MSNPGIFSSLRISGSGLSASRKWMNAASENIANANTTKTESGGPYKKKSIQFKDTLIEKIIKTRDVESDKSSIGELNVTNSRHIKTSLLPTRLSETEELNSVMADVIEDQGMGRKVYAPDHPDADPEGYVLFPNVNIIIEMMDLMTASRAYEANVSALMQAKNMALKALEI